MHYKLILCLIINITNLTPIKTEWVEISQQHYNKPLTGIKSTVIKDFAPKDVQSDVSFLNPWGKGTVYKVHNVASVKRVTNNVPEKTNNNRNKDIDKEYASNANMEHITALKKTELSNRKNIDKVKDILHANNDQIVLKDTDFNDRRKDINKEIPSNRNKEHIVSNKSDRNENRDSSANRKHNKLNNFDYSNRNLNDKKEFVSNENIERNIALKKIDLSNSRNISRVTDIFRKNNDRIVLNADDSKRNENIEQEFASDTNKEHISLQKTNNNRDFNRVTGKFNTNNDRITLKTTDNSNKNIDRDNVSNLNRDYITLKNIYNGNRNKDIASDANEEHISLKNSSNNANNGEINLDNSNKHEDFHGEFASYASKDRTTQNNFDNSNINDNSDRVTDGLSANSDYEDEFETITEADKNNTAAGKLKVTKTETNTKNNNGKETFNEKPNQNAKNKEEPSSNSIPNDKVENIIKFLKIVTDTISKNTHKSFGSKIRYLRGLRDSIMASIEDRIEATWPDDSPRRSARSPQMKARGHVDFPSSESALMTLSFLTFAVFLIKLVLQVIQTYKNKTMMMTPTVFTVGKAAINNN